MDLLMDWLSAPLVGQGEHHIAPWAMWHARSMVLAWGFLLPLGASAARFFKVLPGQNWPTQVDHTGWWHVHRAFQWAGFGLMLLGLYLVDGQGHYAEKLANMTIKGGGKSCVYLKKLDQINLKELSKIVAESYKRTMETYGTK